MRGEFKAYVFLSALSKKYLPKQGGKEIKMSIVIDVLLVALFVFVLVWFARYGFAKTIFMIGKTWMSLFTAFILGPFISDLLQDLFLLDLIKNGINATLTTVIECNPNGYNLEQLFQNLPEGLVHFLENFDVSVSALIAEYGSDAAATKEILNEMSIRIAMPCADLSSQLIGHVVCFIFPLVFFGWTNYKIKQRRTLFFFYVDHITGFVVGVILGYVAAMTLALFVHMIFQIAIALDAGSGVMQIYESSYVFRFFNEFDVWALIT